MYRGPSLTIRSQIVSPFTRPAVGIVVSTWFTGAPDRLSSVVSLSRAAPELNSQSSFR